jgi:DMATS type aromatic prenyltransferase
MQATRLGGFHELCSGQTERLWRAVHKQSAPPSVHRVIELLVPPALEPSLWPSYISDDHTPYELSLLVGKTSTEIRLMAEPLPLTPRVTLADTVAAGARLRNTLESEFGVSFERFDRIADLFLPPDPEGAFALWFAASFAEDGTPAFKVYLNPAIRGRAEAPRLIEEALQRLQVRGAWACVTNVLSRGPDLDELRFFSIDLGVSESARVKVYGFHHDATIEDLVRTIRAVPDAQPDAVAAFCKTLAGGSGTLKASRQPATCLAFVGDDPRPKTGTVHVPIRVFAGDDLTAHSRVSGAMAELGISPAPYEAAVSALAARPLDEGSGIVAWAAVRTGGGSLKANVYLAPKALVDEPTRPNLRPTPRADDPEAVVRKYEGGLMVAHPFFRRLAREPFDLRPLAMLVLNIREAITLHFARRLASVVARVEEDAIRSVLAKQLNDELGNGDPQRTHKLLFEEFAAGLSSRIGVQPSTGVLEPGRRFGAVQDDVYLTRSAYEGLGATLIMEVLGKQGDLTLGRLLRRAPEPLPDSVMEWLVLHEELEFAHVDESFELARMLPSGTKASLAVRGAEEIGRAGWAFLDDMYRLCFTEAA